MAVRVDPEDNETHALLDLADPAERRVLEIGCGDGRLTLRYAARAGHVTAVDSWEEGIRRAKESLPAGLKSRVEYLHKPFLEFASTAESRDFDIAILAWSL